MNIRLYNARIMTMEEPGVITEGEIWVNDNKICYVGADKREDLEELIWDREIDCQKNLL